MVKETNKATNRSNLLPYLALLAVLAAQLAFRLFLNQWEFFGDDACITFRYAQNLAWGRGFVYNPGEHVLGTTTPLYALILAVPVWLGMAVGAASRLVNIASDIFCVLLVFQVIKRISGRYFAALIGAIIYAVSPFFTLFIMKGMEYSLVSLLMLLTVSFMLARKQIAFGVVTALALILRVDLALFVLIMYITVWVAGKKFPLKELITTALVYLPWLIFSVLYFGSPVPVTLSAKLVQFVANTTFANNLEAMANSLGMLAAPILAYIVLAVLGLVANFKKLVVVALALWSLLYILAQLIFSPPFFAWYYLPLLVSLSILAGLGWGAIAGFAQRLFKSKAVCVALAVLVCLATAAVTIPLWTGRMARMVFLNTYEFNIARQAGTWCAVNLQEEATLMSPAPGYEGIFTRIRILDLGCLVSPQLLKYFRGRNYVDASRMAILAEKPDFLELFDPADPRTASETGYLPLKKFLYKGGKKARQVMIEHIIYANPQSEIAGRLLGLKSDGDVRFKDESIE